MNEQKLNDILQELQKPFHPSHIYWKPGSLSRDQTKALALPYADLRAYQNRLDEVCGAAWSVTYTPWHERIVCHLSIGGVTRSSTGEPDSQSEKSEIAGTSAEAQAFKRACAMFSLGRYLYQMPVVWVEYDAQARQFSEQAKAKLAGIVALHYQRAMSAEPATAESPEPEEHEANAAEAVPAPEAGVEKLRKQLHALGTELYGERWGEVRRSNVQRITDGQSTSSDDLNAAQLQKLISGMKQVRSKRRRARVSQKQSAENGADA